MPLYDAAKPLEALEQPKILRFADHVRIVSQTGFGKVVEDDPEMVSLAEELDGMLESDFDEAAVPTY